MGKRIICFYGSERIRGRSERRRAKHDLRQGREPLGKYFTRKFWTD